MTITNVMRLLKQANIPFETSEYEVDESDLSGVHAAQMLNIDPDCMFKTLVAKGEKKGVHVFCIPVAEELDLKKCAQAAGEKKIELIHVKELLGLTGYVRGGCSPVGMKKAYPTVFHELAEIIPTIMVSAGKIGWQIECRPDELIGLVGAKTADIIQD